ncbi:MAG: prepilin-type N-terminal cleavage/methylation domain-containing protein [Verrucomicrobiia bacterium]|jgi:type IV pilus assembly protein PilA
MKSLWQRRKRQAFTLIEIMIIVALIGLLAVLAIPSFIKDRKQSQGRRIVNDARQMDAAINAWALETGQSDNAPIDTSSSTGPVSYVKGGRWWNTDLLGNPYDFTQGVGSQQILIAQDTKDALAGVGIDWGPY